MKYQVKLTNGKILQIEANSILDVLKLGEAVGEIEYIQWDALAVESSEWLRTRDFYEDYWWIPEFSPISCIRGEKKRGKILNGKNSKKLYGTCLWMLGSNRKRFKS